MAPTALPLTRHLETMVQNGHEVRVGFTVSQPLPGQLKHLSGTFCVYVDLFHRENKPGSDSNVMIPIRGRVHAHRHKRTLG